MKNAWRFSFLIMFFVLPLFIQTHIAEPTERNKIQIQLQPLRRSSVVVVAEERFVDNGDGTVTDTKNRIMWQKGDNGKEVTFENAEQYCKTLRLGGYADWRLPKPDERDTAVIIELLMPMHSRDAHAHFDLYWSSDPTGLIPFNYRPSAGKEVSRVYFAREGTRAFVRAVRSLGTAKPAGGG